MTLVITNSSLSRTTESIDDDLLITLHKKYIRHVIIKQQSWKRKNIYPLFVIISSSSSRILKNFFLIVESSLTLFFLIQ